MKKQTLFAAAIMGAAAMITTSCSSEDNFESMTTTPQAEVRFQTNITPMSRAVTTASNLNKFKTTAFLKQDDVRTTFMDAVTVENIEGVWKTTDAYVWPYNGTLSFFSVAPASLKVEMPSASDFDTKNAKFEFTAASDAAMQSDILYAVNANHQYTGSAASSVVNVNFRHALSQVVFNAKCENEKWQVDISDVKIHNLKSTGVYAMPLETTAALTSGNNVRGAWTLGDAINSYNTGIPEPKKNIGSEVVTLTSSTSLPLLLLPQTSTAWDPKNDSKCEKKGTYFTIRCQLRQKTAEGNQIIIWPASGDNAYVDVAIPVTVNWEEGKKYTYTFNFKDGAGFIPPTQTGGGDDVIPGNPVLNAISFSVAVDNFADNNGDVVKL